MDAKFETMELKEEFDRGIINVGNLVRFQKVIRKAISGEPVTVGFIGGSITMGAAATIPEKCYAYLVYLWWKKKFPNCQVTYINAGIGATNSKFGVARVEQDLLYIRPDIVFAEFSVNDGDSDLYMETFEGLVRKILLSPCEPALFMFNNAFYDDGRNAQRVHNTIGKYYNLPIVSVRESIYFEIKKGSLKNTDISADNLHPNDLGHTLVAGLIINLLEVIYEKVTRNEMTSDTDMVPERPYTQNQYQISNRWNNKNSSPETEGFVKDDTTPQYIGDFFHNGWYAKKAGSRIRFEVTASQISIQYRKYAVHPAPIAKVMIDGDEQNAVAADSNFEETWGDCLYLQDVFSDDIPKKHTIEVEVIDEAADKVFYLASVITA